MAYNNNNSGPSAQQRINQIWDRIENKLKTSDTETFNRLKSLGGVSNDEIMQAEMVIGFDFPQEFVASLKRHDLTKEIEIFSVYGYKNSFGDMLEHYLKNLNESNYDLEGLFPIFSFNEEGGKFFVCLDLDTGILCFIDYGGESYVASGRVIAWSFTEYLESLAKNLEANKIPYRNTWPPVSFGFHGTEDIFRLLPAKRLFKVSQSEDGASFDWKFSIHEAFQNPTENIEADVPEFYVDVKNLPPAPKGTGAEFPSLKWDDQRSSQGVVLKSNGATLRGEGYNIQVCSTQVLPTRAYFEIEVGPRVSVSAVGVAAETFTAHTDEGQNGLRITWTGAEIHIFAGTNHTAMLYPKEEDQDVYAQFQKGERIGVLLDVVDGDRTIQFYRNRVPFGNISLAQMVGKAFAAQRFRAYADISLAEVTFVDLH